MLTIRLDKFATNRLSTFKMSQEKPRSKSEPNLNSFENDDILESRHNSSSSSIANKGQMGSRKSLKRSTSLSSLRENRLTEEMRNHIVDLKQQLMNEKILVKQLKRDKVLDINMIKDEQQKKFQTILNEKEFQYKREFEKELFKEKESLKKQLERDYVRTLSEKETEFQSERESWYFEKENLLQKIQNLSKNSQHQSSEEKFSLLKQKYDKEIYNLHEDNKYLQEEIKIFQEAGRNHVVENKKLHEEHIKEIEKLKRSALLESKMQLSEIKQLQNVIEQLEKKLGFEAGTCMRLQMEKDALDAALSKMKQAESRNSKIMKGTDHRGSEFDIEGLIMELPARLSSKPHNDPERVLHRKYVEVCSLVRRLDESNQQLSLKNSELLEENKELNESINPLEEKIVKLGNKNMELSQLMRKNDTKVKDLQKDVMDKEEKIIHLQHLIEKKDKKLKKNKKKENLVSEEDYEDLQRQLSEQLQIISELRQQNIDKDRRIDVLKKRSLSEKQQLLAKKRKSLSLDSLDLPELFDATDETTKLDDIDNIIDENNENKVRYTKLTKEHLQLQNAYALLQRQCFDTKDPQRSELQKEALQSDILVLQATVAELENQLNEKSKFESADTNQKNEVFEGIVLGEDVIQEKERANIDFSVIQSLTDENKDLQMKLISSESELVEKTIQLKQLTEELQELLDRNDLMEFQIAELEQGKKISSGDGKLKLTDGDRKYITTEVDEVECDAISIRIALKELEINNRNNLSDNEKQTLAQARGLVDKGAAEIHSLQDEIHNINVKLSSSQKQCENAVTELKRTENELFILQQEKLKNEERHLTSVDDLLSYGKTNRPGEISITDKMQLDEARKRISELEKTNEMLVKKWETSGGSKAEFSEDEIVILRERMEQMREAEKKINLLQLTNDDLIRRLEDFQGHRGEVSDGLQASDGLQDGDSYLLNKQQLPDKLSEEIESLRFENQQLLDELGTLKSTADGALAIAERTREALNRDDRATQTPSLEYTNFSATLANLANEESNTRPLPPLSREADKRTQACQTVVNNTQKFEVIEKTYVKEVRAEPIVRVDHYSIADDLEKFHSPNEEQLNSDNEFIQRILQEYDERKKTQRPVDQHLEDFGVYLHETLPEDNSKSSSEKALSDFSVQAQNPSSSRKTDLTATKSRQKSPRSVVSYLPSSKEKDELSQPTVPLSIDVETSQEDVEDIPLDNSEDQASVQPHLPSTCSTCGLTPPHQTFVQEGNLYPYNYIPRAYSAPNRNQPTTAQDPGYIGNSYAETMRPFLRINSNNPDEDVSYRDKPLLPPHASVDEHLLPPHGAVDERLLPPQSVVLNKEIRPPTYDRSCYSPDDSISYADRDIRDLLNYAKHLRHEGAKILTDTSPLTLENIALRYSPEVHPNSPCGTPVISAAQNRVSSEQQDVVELDSRVTQNQLIRPSLIPANLHQMESFQPLQSGIEENRELPEQNTRERHQPPKYATMENHHPSERGVRERRLLPEHGVRESRCENLSMPQSNTRQGNSFGVSSHVDFSPTSPQVVSHCQVYKEDVPEHSSKYYCRCDVDSGIGSLAVDSKKSRVSSPNFWSPRHAPTRYASETLVIKTKEVDHSEATSKDITSLPKERSCVSPHFEHYNEFANRLENRSVTSTPDGRLSNQHDGRLVNQHDGRHSNKENPKSKRKGSADTKKQHSSRSSPEVSETIFSDVQPLNCKNGKIKSNQRRHSTGSLYEYTPCDDRYPECQVRDKRLDESPIGNNEEESNEIASNESLSTKESIMLPHDQRRKQSSDLDRKIPRRMEGPNVKNTLAFFKTAALDEDQATLHPQQRPRGRNMLSGGRFSNLPQPLSRRSYSHSPVGRFRRRQSRSPFEHLNDQNCPRLTKNKFPSDNSIDRRNNNVVLVTRPLKLPENPSSREGSKHRLDQLIEDTDRRLNEEYEVLYGRCDHEQELIFEEEDLRQAKKEINFLREKCESLERQLQNRDDILYNLQNELREESENIALIEKKDKEIHLKAESISHITQMLQKTRKELEIKISECNRRESEVKHLKQELKTVLTEKKTIESSHSEQQITIAKLESVETKLQQLTVRYDEVVQHNRELLERVKTLEISEKEFIDLERNVIDLQVQLRDMEDIELHRDELYQKLQYVKKQRDEFLEKGKLVEEERNEFVRSNKTLEQYLAEWKRKTVEFKKTNQALKDRIISLERDKKELEERIIHLQEERVVIQTSLNKVELERDDYIRELKEVSIERNSLETRLGDLEDMLGDYDQLEEGFHSLRLKVAELTRQRDDAEMLIPSYKQKLSMLKKALHDKEDTVMQLSHDLKTLKVAVENCTYEDLTRLKSFNYLSSDSSLPRRPSFSNKKYRPSDYDLTTDSDSIDPLFIRPSQTYESYSDDSIQKRAPKQRRHKSRRCVALFDYDPYRSSTSDHPERELRLREGDYITVYGEMDIDGYLEAEVDGIRGLVPSIYVEEISEDGSMDYRRPGNQYHSDYSDELVRKFRVMYDYDPFTMATTDTVDRQLSLRKGDVVTVYGNMDEDGYYYAQRNGKRGLIPSNFVEEYHSSGSGSHHQHTHHTQQQQNQTQQSANYQGTIGQSANYQGTIGQSANYQGTIEIEEDAGPPYAPRDLKVVRVVTRNAVLLGWGLPPMDEYGRSNGCRVTGYRLWVNGKRKQDCNSPSMTKALVDNVDLHGRVEFSIQTVGENGFCSEKCHFAITGALSALSKDNDFELDGNHNTYVALYDYDPFKSSPNPNPSLELSFQEGDLIRVYDKSRNDGFYGAEINGKRGLVPSNFIERIGGSTSGSYHHHQHHSSTTAHHDSDSNSRRVQFK